MLSVLCSEILYGVDFTVPPYKILCLVYCVTQSFAVLNVLTPPPPSFTAFRLLRPPKLLVLKNSVCLKTLSFSVTACVFPVTPSTSPVHSVISGHPLFTSLVSTVSSCHPLYVPVMPCNPLSSPVHALYGL